MILAGDIHIGTNPEMASSSGWSPKLLLMNEGTVRLLEPIKLQSAYRALVTVLEEEPAVHVNETALLSEPALAVDWNRPEEDTAWSHLTLAQ